MAKTGKNITDRLGNSPGAARISGVKGSSGSTRPRPRPGEGKGAPAPSGTVRPVARTPNKTSSSKTASSPSSLSVSGSKGGGSAPASSTRPRARSETGQSPFQSTRDAMASRRTPVGGSATTRPRARPERSESAPTYARWKAMTRAERREAGLPISDMPEAAWNQAMSRR